MMNMLNSPLIDGKVPWWVKVTSLSAILCILTFVAWMLMNVHPTGAGVVIPL